MFTLKELKELFKIGSEPTIKKQENPTYFSDEIEMIITKMLPGDEFLIKDLGEDAKILFLANFDMDYYFMNHEEKIVILRKNQLFDLLEQDLFKFVWHKYKTNSELYDKKGVLFRNDDSLYESEDAQTIVWNKYEKGIITYPDTDNEQGYPPETFKKYMIIQLENTEKNKAVSAFYKREEEKTPIKKERKEKN